MDTDSTTPIENDDGPGFWEKFVTQATAPQTTAATTGAPPAATAPVVAAGPTEVADMSLPEYEAHRESLGISDDGFNEEHWRPSPARPSAYNKYGGGR